MRDLINAIQSIISVTPWKLAEVSYDYDANIKAVHTLGRDESYLIQGMADEVVRVSLMAPGRHYEVPTLPQTLAFGRYALILQTTSIEYSSAEFPVGHAGVPNSGSTSLYLTGYITT